MEDFKIVGFNVTVGTARKSSLHSVVSKGFILLPCTVASNKSERYNLGFEDCVSFVVLLRLIMHKENKDKLITTRMLQFYFPEWSSNYQE